MTKRMAAAGDGPFALSCLDKTIHLLAVATILTALIVAPLVKAPKAAAQSAPTIYAVSQGGIVPIPTTTDTSDALIPYNVSGLFYPDFDSPVYEAMDPTGTNLWVAAQDGLNAVLEPINIASGSAGSPITLPGTQDTHAVAVSPDGSKVWVLSNNSDEDEELTGYTTSSATLGSNISVCGAGDAAPSFAINSTDTTAYVACGTPGEGIESVNLSTGATQSLSLSLSASAWQIVTAGTNYLVISTDINIVIFNLSTDSSQGFFSGSCGESPLTTSSDGSTVWIGCFNDLYSVVVATATTSGPFLICHSCTIYSLAESGSGTAIYAYAQGEVIPVSTSGTGSHRSR